MKIRPFREGDAEALAEIFFTSVREIASHYYTPEQIAAWAPTLPEADSFARRAVDGRTLLVAVDAKNRPIAYGDLESNGHIDHFYCSPGVAGRGIAKRLYRELEAAARDCGASVIFVEASEPARRFFQKQGFELINRNDFQLNGVAILNYNMRKALS